MKKKVARKSVSRDDVEKYVPLALEIADKYLGQNPSSAALTTREVNTACVLGTIQALTDFEPYDFEIFEKNLEELVCENIDDAMRPFE